MAERFDESSFRCKCGKLMVLKAVNSYRTEYRFDCGWCGRRAWIVWDEVKAQPVKLSWRRAVA